MNKRTILLLALALIFVVLSIIGYIEMKREPDTVTPFQAMSNSTTAVLVVNDYARTFENLLHNNLMWQELMNDEDMTSLATNLLLLDSLIRSNDWSAELKDDLKWHIAFHAIGNRLENTIVIPFVNENINDVKEWFSFHSETLSKYSDFEKVEINKCVFKENVMPPLYFTFFKGLLLAADKPNLIEDAIRVLMEGNSLGGSADFQKVQKTSGAFADWNFYINYSDPNSLNLLGLDVAKLSSYNVAWSGWTALDATIHPDLLLLNGFSNAGNDSYLSLFSKQKSQDVDAIEIIPEDVSLFFHFGLSNYKSYSKSKRAYFKLVGKEKAYLKKVNDLKQNYGVDLEAEFDQWVSNEFGIMFLPNNEIEATDSKVAFFRLSDIRRTLSVLDALSEIEGEAAKNDFKQIPIEGFLDDFESVLFKNLNKPYFTVIDKYLLMSNHESLLNKMKKDYLQANTLKKSELYSRFSGNLSDQSNIYIYIHLEGGAEVYKEVMSDDFNDFLSENQNIPSKFEQIGIQFKDGRKNMFYQHMALNYNPKQRSQGNILWEVELDTNLLMKPQVVYNHYNNAREILVQDVSNTVYLIDNKGNIVWKRQMKEKIQSKVYQIDVYKNNKLQMLFSGESSIYLIDRKGRDVENFPIQLPAVATNQLKIIDYEKNREYRILIGIRGGEVLNFDRFGKPIKGWKFKTSDEVTYPIDYFLLNKKDYIITVGAEGKPYIMNRRGEIRLKIDEKLPAYADKPYFLELSNDINQCKFVTTDESGNFVKLQFNGEKEIINLDLISNEHQFLYEDINNDRKNDYILLDSNRLMVFENSREKLFEIELEGNDPAYLNTYRFDGGYGKIGFTDIETSQIYLYRDAGGLDNNFPLKGNTPFSITDLNKDGRQNLLVGLNNRLIVYNLK